MRGRMVVAVTVALLLASIVGSAQTRRRDPAVSSTPQSANCGIVGTWMHSAGPADKFTWTLVVTPGANATVGQLDYEWVVVDPTLLGMFKTAVRTTSPKGVWEKVRQGEYNFTWVAYGFDEEGMLIYVLRPNGVAAMTSCDEFNFVGRYDVFTPDQDIWSDAPRGSVPVNEAHRRMPLVVQ